jgi:hypothetical protein
MTVLKNKHLKEIEVDGTNGTSVTNEIIWFQNTFQRLRDILAAPDGRVFLATSGSSWANTQPFTHSIIELKNSSYSPTGVEEAVQSVETKVYPNPTDGITTMVFAKELVGTEYTIADFTGRQVSSGLISSANMTSNFSGLASGLYVVQATNGKYATSERIEITK